MAFSKTSRSPSLAEDQWESDIFWFIRKKVENQSMPVAG
jgi:hypothetical protein